MQQYATGATQLQGHEQQQHHGTAQPSLDAAQHRFMDTAATHAAAAAAQKQSTRTTRRTYRPLDVKTWGDGFRVTIGWILIMVFAIVLGALSAVYEVRKGGRQRCAQEVR